jgi:flavin-dependent dehydrogenase
MASRDYDAIIIGAGPGGCGAARLLAGWKHRVLLIDRPGGQSRMLAESIPPSAQKVLSALGMLTAIEDAGFAPWRGNTVWWADAPVRSESFGGAAAGYQVERHRFDDVLRRLAIESGAEHRHGRVIEARIPGLSGMSAGDAPSVSFETDGGLVHASASIVLDCSGRAGVVARHGLRRTESPARTIALVGVWQSATSFAGANPAHTLVASYDDGWGWSVSASPGVRHVTVMVDPSRTNLARGESAVEVYRSELHKITAFRALLAEATLSDGPSGADASPYDALAYAGDGFLLVGDAGSFIDPLSSFGVKKALASAWLAAIAAHTAIATPSMREEALAFFNRRERELAAAAMQSSARVASDAARSTPHPFWLARAEPAENDDLEGSPDATALARDPDVQGAFADLKQRPVIRLRIGPAVRIAPRAAVRGREIVMDDHLFAPAWPDGVRYLRNVDLVGLVRLAPAHADVGELFGAFVAEHRDVPLPDFLGALSVLIARGALEYAE